MNEQEMRNAEVLTPKSLQELANYIETLQGHEHDYGTCVYAMSMAATAAFNYMASALGVTGFQASCADLDIIRRTRHMEGPFILLKAEDMVYPQYDLHKKLDEFMIESAPWVKEQASIKLRDTNKEFTHPDVIAHWESLANA